MSAYVKCNICHAKGSLARGQNAVEIAQAIWNHEPVKMEKYIENQTTLIDQIEGI